MLSQKLPPSIYKRLQHHYEVVAFLQQNYLHQKVLNLKRKVMLSKMLSPSFHNDHVAFLQQNYLHQKVLNLMGGEGGGIYAHPTSLMIFLHIRFKVIVMKLLDFLTIYIIINLQKYLVTLLF